MLDLHLDLDVSELFGMKFIELARHDVNVNLPPCAVSPSYHEDLIEARAAAMELQVWGCLDAKLP